MGKVSRSLSGTPWHIEKGKGTGIRNNTNCAFNVQGRCSCISSCNHNNVCVGKIACEEFEYGMSKRTGGKPIRLSKDTQQEESKNNSRNKRRIKKLFVECGDSITIGDKNGQLIDLKIMDKNNPFIGRIRFEVVTIKNEKYTIWKIRKKK